MAPAEVREIRESLGLSQPVFADCLGTSLDGPILEQGQKPPSPMARRFLGLISLSRRPALLDESVPLDDPDARR